MARKHNTDKNGGSFSEETKKTVWNKAEIILGVDSAQKRKNHCGAWIEE